MHWGKKDCCRKAQVPFFEKTGDVVCGACGRRIGYAYRPQGRKPALALFAPYKIHRQELPQHLKDQCTLQR